MTRDEALRADVFHFGNCTRTTGPRGGVRTHTEEYKRAGANKTWKTRPEDFRVPVKHGMRGYGEVVPANVAQFHTPAQCPLNDSRDHTADESHVTRVQEVTYSTLPGITFYRCVCTCGFIGDAERFLSTAEIQRATHYGTPIAGIE